MRSVFMATAQLWLLGMAAWAVPVDFFPPTHVAELNTEFVDRDPAVSSDGLEVFFVSDRPGGSGDWDIWHATRLDTSSPFDAPVAVAAVNSLGREANPDISEDGLTLYMSRDWAGHTQFTDIYVSTRPDRSSSFSAPQLVGELSTAAYDGSTAIAPNGLSSHFARSTPSNGEDIFLATRPSTSSVFGAPERVDSLSTAHHDRQPWVSSDETMMFLSSNRPSAFGTSFQTYVTDRASTGDPFGPPLLVADVGSQQGAGHPSYYEAGGLLYFSSHRPGGSGSTDIWVAQARPDVIPEPATLTLLALGGLALLRRRKKR